MSLTELRNLALRILHDCSGSDCDRLRLRIHCAQEPRDIWLMRCDILEVLADQQPATAAARIEELLPALEGRTGLFAAI
jgi:hypothetical protein